MKLFIITLFYIIFISTSLFSKDISYSIEINKDIKLNLIFNDKFNINCISHGVRSSLSTDYYDNESVDSTYFPDTGIIINDNGKFITSNHAFLNDSVIIISLYDFVGRVNLIGLILQKDNKIKFIKKGTLDELDGIIFSEANYIFLDRKSKIIITHSKRYYKETEDNEIIDMDFYVYRINGNSFDSLKDIYVDDQGADKKIIDFDYDESDAYGNYKIYSWIFKKFIKR